MDLLHMGRPTGVPVGLAQTVAQSLLLESLALRGIGIAGHWLAMVRAHAGKPSTGGTCQSLGMARRGLPCEGASRGVFLSRIFV
jgi:hypothetical protein